MKKILLISNGDSIHTIKWIIEFEKKYKILLFDWRPILTDKYKYLNNVTIIPPPKFFVKTPLALSYLITFFSIKKITNNISFDIIHSHYATSYGLLGVRAKKNKLITSVWGSDISDFPNKSFLHLSLIKYVLNKSDYIFSTSKYLNKIVKKIVNKESLLTPFGVEISNTAYVKKDKTITFGTAKNLTQNSGLDISIKYFSILKNIFKEKKIKFEIAGDGPFKKNIESIITKLGLEKDVNLLGHIDHKMISQFMKSIDVYINLAKKESFGVAVLEASAAGKPVISSNVEGLKEVVLHKETGLLVDLNDQQGVIGAMIEMVENDNKRSLLGSNGKKFVQENYSWNKSKKIILNHYEKILNEKL